MLQQLFADEVLFWVKEDRPNSLGIATAEVPTPVAKAMVVPSVPQTITQAPKAVFKHQHKVLVVVASLTEADTELLEKILKAINLSLSDIDLLNLSDYPDTDLKPMLETKKVHHVITFGVALSKIGLSVLLTPYQISQVSGIHFLYADPFVNLHQEATKKKLLWGSLKTMFEV